MSTSKLQFHPSLFLCIQYILKGLASVSHHKKSTIPTEQAFICFAFLPTFAILSLHFASCDNDNPSPDPEPSNLRGMNEVENTCHQIRPNAHISPAYLLPTFSPQSSQFGLFLITTNWDVSNLNNLAVPETHTHQKGKCFKLPSIPKVLL